MPDARETLEALVAAAKVYPSGFSMPRLDIQLMQREVDAIREVLAENRGHLANNENLADSCKQYERRAVKAEAENERLRAENYDLRHHAYSSGLPEHDDGMPDLLTAAEARIDAALALHVSKVDPESPSRYCSMCGTASPCPTVKALKGEA